MTSPDRLAVRRPSSLKEPEVAHTPDGRQLGELPDPRQVGDLPHQRQIGDLSHPWQAGEKCHLCGTGFQPVGVAQVSNLCSITETCLSFPIATLPRTAFRTAVTIAALLLYAGCTPPSRPAPLDPLPLDQAVETINDNNRRIIGVLKAEGRVVARVRTSENRVRTFDLEGILIFAPPDHLRFTLKHDLGGDQLIVGANDRQYWFHDLTAGEPPKVRSLDHLVNGRDSDFPVQPRQIIEAIGLSPLPDGAELHPMRRPVQRVESEDQQLLFLDYDDSGAPRLEKEYWLARFDPRLVRRIVFRDAMGRIEMESQLSEHQPLGDIGPLVPFHVSVDWPMEGSRIEFSVSKWQMMPDKGKDLPAFQPPAESRE